MNLKTYRANSMADALTEVKKDLGKDAVILHTRTYKVGGMLGMGRRSIVEITASNDPGVAKPPRSRKIAPRKRSDVLAAYGADTPGGTLSLMQDQTSKPEQAVEVAQHQVTQEVADAARNAAQIAISRPSGSTERPRDSIEAELAAIRRLVGQVLHTSHRAAMQGQTGSVGAANGTMSDPLAEEYLNLMESEVAAEIADEIVGAVRDELNPGELRDPLIVRQTVLRRLADLIPIAADVSACGKSEDGRPLTIALIGPTGVGKTTTIAKLAATYKLRHGKKVGLITTDTYRIAAVDQLRTYAEIINVPLKVVMTVSEMAAACEAFIDCDVILIDNAGRSQHDGERLTDLKRFIETARPHETHLVLASNASQSVLFRTAERFAQLGPNRLLFTKLDEAVNFGVLVGVARHVDLKLSYVTTGQEVPDHIEHGTPDRLARLILEGALPK